MRTKTASAIACSPVPMPVFAIAAAAPTVSTRFFGLMAESATPIANARCRVKRSIVRIQLGSAASASPRGRPRHCLSGHEQQQRTEDELEDAHPGRRPARLAGVGAARHEQDDRADDAQADQPAQDERRAVRARPRRAEHQDDADDRNRAERDDDAEGQDLSDRVAHGAGTIRAAPVR